MNASFMSDSFDRPTLNTNRHCVSWSYHLLQSAKGLRNEYDVKNVSSSKVRLSVLGFIAVTKTMEPCTYGVNCEKISATVCFFLVECDM